MNWKNVKLIFVREIRDQLRDRRTVFMVAVLPILLYPVIGIGVIQMKTAFTEQQRSVLILGADDLPQFCKDCPASSRRAKAPLLDGNHFHKRHFGLPQQAEQLLVHTDRSGAETPDADADVQRLIDQSAKIRRQIARQRSLKPDDPALKDVNRKLRQQMADAGIQVLVVVPRGFAKSLAGGKPQPGGDSGILVLRNSADAKSTIADRRTRGAINKWREAYGSNPVRIDVVEVAEKSQISANIWSRLFPGLLVIMAVTGAFYPAVDVAAGEKERGTMETLLICPASRPEIVVGKFLTVMAFSMTTAMLNLAAMGLTGKIALSAIQTGAGAGGIAAPSLAAIGWVILLLIPLAAMFSALSLAFATFARSSKEGQYYLTPLLMVTMGITIFCLSPGHDIKPFSSLVPVMGPTLLLKELLSPSAGGNALLYLVPVLVTSFGYSALALWWAIDQFSREDILFRGAERFSPQLWVKHLLRDKEPTPSFSEAGSCFVLMMLLQFGAFSLFSKELRELPVTQTLLITQFVIIATPALLMGVMLTSSARRTFRWNWPRWRYLAIAVALPLVIHPVLVELSSGLKWFFPKLPDSFTRQLASMHAQDTSLWFALLVFAAVPAVCEETAFRGFILSGFSRRNRVWLGILLSSALFGLIHMIPQQMFNTALLGVVIAMLAIRSNSLLPGIVFHFTNNALVVANGRIAAASPELFDDAPVSWFTGISGGQIRFETPAVILGALLAAVMIRTLIPKREDVHSQIEDGAFDRDDNLDSIENRDGQPLEVGAQEETTNRAN